jgi:hypothetical protein
MHVSPYTAVDRAITAWAAEHQLLVCVNYKDYEVRSADVRRPRRSLRQRLPFQIWVDVPGGCSNSVPIDRVAPALDGSASSYPITFNFFSGTASCFRGPTFGPIALKCSVWAWKSNAASSFQIS